MKKITKSELQKIDDTYLILIMLVKLLDPYLTLRTRDLINEAESRIKHHLENKVDLLNILLDNN